MAVGHMRVRSRKEKPPEVRWAGRKGLEAPKATHSHVEWCGVEQAGPCCPSPVV